MNTKRTERIKLSLLREREEVERRKTRKPDGGNDRPDPGWRTRPPTMSEKRTGRRDKKEGKG